ncbi:MAG: transglycosylase domain-containing protein [Alphaproteobacteria bacterium]|nr:transglycosylase domain-containing protein [Alphaproteobacteria bacterium]
MASRHKHRRKTSKPAPKKKGRVQWAAVTVICAAVVAVSYFEIRTSAIEAYLLSAYDDRIAFDLEPEVNPAMRIPKSGPYNERLGYSYLPFYTKVLETDNFKVAAQMHASPAYYNLLRYGLYPIYRPKTVTGLAMYDRNGKKMYVASYPEHVFKNYEQIPPLLVSTLLYIENRDLLKDGPVTRNPVIEWGRFAYALLGHFVHALVPGYNAGGGSTLATQIEKFRFSPQGQTGSGMEKLRQIASASMRVYQDGPDTRAIRKQIVLDYLNSTTLSARPGFGEINSIGDGLWAWFGIDLDDAVAALELPEDNAASLKEKARVYRAALGLVLAQRRPSYYLQTNRGSLDDLTDTTLDRLEDARVITPALHDATKVSVLKFLPAPPAPPEPPYIEQKAVNALRSHLLNLMGLRRMYEIDRLDITAHTTLDQPAQQQLVEFLKKMGDPVFLQSQGLYGFRLLDPGNDPAKIKWSVVLYERGSDGAKVRLQADNIDQPFDMNEGMKLDLGSTAKLRTLVTYLEIMAELHRRYAGLDPEDLQDLAEDAPDALTGWAIAWLKDHPDADLETMLNASMDRRYSGDNSEVFFTGGGVHTFHNFEHKEDLEVMDLHEAFRQSVNLVFVRVMRDIVNYTIAQGPQTKDELLDDASDPARKAYLERFADEEGGVFLSRYIEDYANVPPAQRADKLAAHAHKSAAALAVLFRSLYPKADFDSYKKFMEMHPHLPVSDKHLTQLYTDYPVTRYDLADRSYIVGVNPMELWLVSYWQDHPDADRRELLSASRDVRIASYAWLFNPNLKHAQDNRIRIMLEQDAFAHIQKRWARLGYPFDRLTPSYATAIGSSADRPGALAELVGIILANGERMPVERFETLEFGAGTPYDTVLKHDDNGQPQHVLDPAICRVMRGVMQEVVQNGTATKVRDVYRDAAGNPLPIGGKTGTGDQRYDEFGHGGHIVSSRVLNRTGTFVFYIGDRFFGAITAHVAGEDAAGYKFSSALSAQMLRDLAPIINPLINEAAPTEETAPPPVASHQALPP